jgi:hypothetical protein
MMRMMKQQPAGGKNNQNENIEKLKEQYTTKKI